MVCSDERQGKFPFDIQHRHIIKYETKSISDFNSLSDTITKKIKAIQQNAITVKTLNTIPVIETEGLKSHEIALLILIMENCITTDDCVSVLTLRNQAGYTDIATSLGIRTLTKYQMIEIFKEIEEWNNHDEYIACRLTEQGEQWIFNNQDQLQFRKVKESSSEEFDLPF